MSWSVCAVGTKDALKRRLAQESERLTGQSKAEFDEVRPALETILDQNVGGNQALKLDAAGHANFVDGKKTYGVCGVSLTNIGQIAE